MGAVMYTYASHYIYNTKVCAKRANIIWYCLVGQSKKTRKYLHSKLSTSKVGSKPPIATTRALNGKLAVRFVGNVSQGQDSNDSNSSVHEVE
jgi:hypothetical protein